MRKVLVICGAGASSTFLVHWMRKVAASRGLEVVVVAGSQADLDAGLDTVDIVLVGHHLHETYPRLREQAAVAGVEALLLPLLSFDQTGAGTALDLVEATAGSDSPAVSSHPGGSHG